MTSTIICFFTLKFWIGTLLPVKGTKTVTENTALAVVVDRNRWAGWFSNDEPTQPIESLMEISDDWQDRGTSGANQISTGAGAPLAPPLDPPLVWCHVLTEHDMTMYQALKSLLYKSVLTKKHHLNSQWIKFIFNIRFLGLQAWRVIWKFHSSLVVCLLFIWRVVFFYMCKTFLFWKLKKRL